MEVKKIGETMTRNLLEEVRKQKDMKGIGKKIKKELFPVLSGSVAMMDKSNGSRYKFCYETS